jgi:hypothetical protein
MALWEDTAGDSGGNRLFWKLRAENGDIRNIVDESRAIPGIAL